MLEKLERVEIGNLKIKWNDLNVISFYSNLIDSALCNECVPCTVGFGLKKLFSHTFIKHNTCCNKLICEHNLESMRRILTSHNVSHVELIDKGCLS